MLTSIRSKLNVKIPECRDIPLEFFLNIRRWYTLTGPASSSGRDIVTKRIGVMPIL